VKVYFISGLGADSRVFRHITLPSDHQAVYLEWIPPSPAESLPSYALRLAEHIDKNEKFSLIGLSFGGMIATEIARHFKPVHTILISSIPSPAQLPGYYKLASALSLVKWMPISLLKKASLVKRFFSPETSEDKKLLREMIRHCDPVFIKWALGAILSWKTEDQPPTVLHLHGTRDAILPLRYTTPTHRIPKGGHIMIMNRADEINRIIHEELKNGSVERKNG
jgi:pimeloyl-ACP methyl ester carboxylesterase